MVPVFSARFFYIKIKHTLDGSSVFGVLSSLCKRGREQSNEGGEGKKVEGTVDGGGRLLRLSRKSIFPHPFGLFLCFSLFLGIMKKRN